MEMEVGNERERAMDKGMERKMEMERGKGKGNVEWKG